MHKKMFGFMDTSSYVSDDWIAVLKRGGYGKSEDELLRAIREGKSKNIVHYAVIGLFTEGTRKSLATLKELTHYPNRDVQASTVVAIELIAGEGETKFYSSLLEDSVYKDKAYPLTVLWEVGSSEAVPDVMRYAEMIIKGEIKAVGNTIDPRYPRDYLEKYKSENPDIERLIKGLDTVIAGIDYD